MAGVVAISIRHERARSLRLKNEQMEDDKKEALFRCNTVGL